MKILSPHLPLTAVLCSSLGFAQEASAQAVRCTTGDQLADNQEVVWSDCASLAQSPDLFQFLVLPTGYSAEEGWDAGASGFRGPLEAQMKFVSQPDYASYTSIYADRLLYVVAFAAGGDVSSPTAAYGAEVDPGNRLALDAEALYAAITELEQSSPWLDPDSVLVFFDGRDGQGRPNAVWPRAEQPLGYAMQHSLRVSSTFAHELGHSFVKWQDEYVEFTGLDARDLDVLLPLGLLHPDDTQTWFTAWDDFIGTYDLTLGESVVGGSDNLALSECPATVGAFRPDEVDPSVSCYAALVVDPSGPFDTEAAHYPAEHYARVGGVFETGVYHQGAVFDGGETMMGARKEYHSASQNRVLTTIFETGAPGRPNDRLRNAGPLTPVLAIGDVRLLGFDADKHHRWQPTTAYDYEISYDEDVWGTCKGLLGLRYPCVVGTRPVVLRKQATPTLTDWEVDGSVFATVAPPLLQALCALGTEFACQATAPGALLDQIQGLSFDMPYQEFHAPLPDLGVSYRWRFRTRNGRIAEHCDHQGGTSPCNTDCGTCSAWTSWLDI